MNKEKQIEEMAKVIVRRSKDFRNPNVAFMTTAKKTAESLYNADYRKASEVAREIFEEIEKEIELAIDSNYRAKKERKNHSVIPNYDSFNAMCDGKIYAMRGLLDFIKELQEKKYTEEGK